MRKMCFLFLPLLLLWLCPAQSKAAKGAPVSGVCIFSELPNASVDNDKALRAFVAKQIVEKEKADAVPLKSTERSAVREEASKAGCLYALSLTTRPSPHERNDESMGRQPPTLFLYDVVSVASDEDAVVVSGAMEFDDVDVSHVLIL